MSGVEHLEILGKSTVLEDKTLVEGSSLDPNVVYRAVSELHLLVEQHTESFKIGKLAVFNRDRSINKFVILKFHGSRNCGWTSVALDALTGAFHRSRSSGLNLRQPIPW